MTGGFDGYFARMKALCKDNDERGVHDTYPCPVCYSFTKDDIDNPPFGDGEWKEFWRMSKENFPLHSVCGGRSGNSAAAVISIEKDCLQKHLYAIYGKRWSEEIRGKRVLEIGYGFGGAGIFLIDGGADYVGIDYVSSNHELPRDRFFEIDRSGIPGDMLSGEKFDLIYSYNVMQHLTQAQRLEYIAQAHSVMKDDGVLFFSVFERVPGQGLRDTYSTTFFNVHTKVDEPEELQGFLSKTGFAFEHSLEKTLCDETNLAWYVCRKTA